MSRKMPRRRPNPRNINPQPFRREAAQLLRGLRGLCGAGSNILGPAQIRYYAQNAGFSGPDLDTAVAIALAESSGNAWIYNPETAAGAPAGKGSYGLWQIYLNAHPEYAGANLYDPQTNAKAAYAIYSSAGGFSPWSTYKSGAYQSFLQPGAASPAIAPGTSQPVTIDASTGQVISNAPDVSQMPAIDSSGAIVPPADPTAMYLGLGALAVGVWMFANVIGE